MTHYINTVADFYAIKDQLEHIMVRSAKGDIRVPCLSAILVAGHLVRPNTYNPNSVSGNKMAELEQSVLFNGFCFPVATIFDDELEQFVIVDGAHRRIISTNEWLGMEYVPIVWLYHLTMVDCLFATKQFNDARGIHQVDLDAELIRRLSEQGVSDEEISERLQMEIETIHRYKQITGIADLFKNAEYSQSWNILEIPDDGKIQEDKAA